MATQSNDEVIQQLQQILAADDNAAKSDAQKFTAAFRAGIQSAFDELQSAQQAISGSESERKSASGALQAAYDGAAEWIRSVFNRIAALPPNVDTAPLFTAYGFPGGKLSALDHTRIESLLALFPVASDAQSGADQKLPADWLTTLADLQAQIADNKNSANIAARSDRVRVRDAARDVADDLLSRVQHYLFYALPLRDKDPLLNSYGFTPRQPPITTPFVPNPDPAPSP